MEDDSKKVPSSDGESKKASRNKRGIKNRKDKKSRGSNFSSIENDPRFWNRVQGLVGASGRIPSTIPLGMSYDGYGQMMNLRNLASVYQICAIPFIPTIGLAKGKLTDPINTAAQQLYTYIRRAVSGSRPYDAADLVQYIAAVYFAHLGVKKLKKIYGLTNIVSPLNRDIARLLVRAEGVDYDNVVANKANLLFEINNLSYILRQFAVPGDWTIIQHWALLVENIFTDRFVNSMKNQFYTFDVLSIPSYDWDNAEIDYDQPTFIPNNGKVLSQLISAVRNAVNALQGNTDVGIMSGDILRCFEGKILAEDAIDVNYTTPIHITSNEMLNQIRNMNYIHRDAYIDYDMATKFTIQQADNTCLKLSGYDSNLDEMWLPYMTVPESGGTIDFSTIESDYDRGQTLISFDADLDPDKILVATRMMIEFDFANTRALSKETTIGEVGAVSFGVEVFMSPIFMKTNESETNILDSVAQVWATGDIFSGVLDVAAVHSQFEGSPKLFHYGFNNNAFTIGRDFYDFDNVLLVPNELLDDLHYTALQSAFYVNLDSTATVK